MHAPNWAKGTFASCENLSKCSEYLFFWFDKMERFSFNYSNLVFILSPSQIYTLVLHSCDLIGPYIRFSNVIVIPFLSFLIFEFLAFVFFFWLEVEYACKIHWRKKAKFGTILVRQISRHMMKCLIWADYFQTVHALLSLARCLFLFYVGESRLGILINTDVCFSFGSHPSEFSLESR